MDHFSFVDLLRKHHISYMEAGHHHCSQGWIQLDCPWCSRDSGRFRLGYNLAGKYLSCWTCGFHPLTPTLSEITGKSIPECFEMVGGINFETAKEIPRGKLEWPSGIGGLQQAHLRYLKHRGFDPEEVRSKWGLKAIGISHSLSWRIVIPIFYRGVPVSWTTRSISDEVQARYINARPNQERMSPKELLYGEDHARHAVMIVEGPLDVWRIGFGAVATMGTSFSTTQILKLSKYPIRITCFDNEPKAQRRAERLHADLGLFPGVNQNIFLETGKDAASASDKEIQKVRSLLDNARERSLA